MGVLATLKTELESIEQNMHALADGPGALQAKLTEIVKAVVGEIELLSGGSVEGALKNIEALTAQAEKVLTAVGLAGSLVDDVEALKAKLGSFEELAGKIDVLLARVEAIEAHPAVSVPALTTLEPFDAGPAGVFGPHEG